MSFGPFPRTVLWMERRGCPWGEHSDTGVFVVLGSSCCPGAREPPPAGFWFLRFSPGPALVLLANTLC